MSKAKEREIEETGDEFVEEGENVERGEWGSQLEFILTCVGYAVGLGNVWRFPYLCYRNGGGAFLIPYFLMLAFVGLPLFFLELAFGQFASLGPIAIWTVNPFFKGLGFAMVAVNTIVAMYYNVIICWSIYYFFASMTDRLPWMDCENWWNTPYCFTSDEIKELNLTGAMNETISVGNLTFSRAEIKTPSEEYFFEQVLRMSDGIEDMGGIRWQLALCLLLSWTIVFFVLVRGISSLGKVVYFSSIFPYVLLTIMLIRGATLPGAATGIEYYLRPDFERLTDARVWSDAATQIFYSLSACTGGLIAMASFNKFSNNCYRDAILVPLINCGTSFYAGFVIFSVLGFMANEKGVTVDDVADSGPGLVFVVYPEGLTQMPAPPVWAVLFFFMLITLGFSSEFSMTECFFSSISDEWPHIFRKTPTINLIFRAVTIFLFFCATLPMVTNGGFYLFNLVDVYIGGFPLLFVGLFEAIAVTWVYGYSNFAEDISIMLGHKPNIYFKITWVVLIPVILFAIIIFMSIQYEPLMLDDYAYPPSALAIGWLIVLFPIVCIPLWMVVTLCSQGGFQVLKDVNQPTSDWGPSDKKHRENNKYGMTYEEEQETVFATPATYAFGDMRRGSSTVSIPNSSIMGKPPPSYNGNGYSNGGSYANGGISEVKMKPINGDVNMYNTDKNEKAEATGYSNQAFDTGNTEQVEAIGNSNQAYNTDNNEQAGATRYSNQTFSTVDEQDVKL